MSMSKITVVREWWQVETKDRKGDLFYITGMTRTSEGDARWFIENRLCGNRRKYAIVAHHVETKEILP